MFASGPVPTSRAYGSRELVEYPVSGGLPKSHIDPFRTLAGGQQRRAARRNKLGYSRFGAALQVALGRNGARPHRVAIATDPTRLVGLNVDQSEGHVYVIEGIELATKRLISPT